MASKSKTKSKTKTKQSAPQNISKGGVMIDYQLTYKAAQVARAFNNSFRKRILDLLNNKGTLTVTEIYVTLRLEQSVVSQHLSVLRKAGIVKTERDGKLIYYTLNKIRIKQLHQLFAEMI
jgi:DNA-binding transcriptional ArsR family regulator